MKIKKGFVLRRMGDSWMAVPIGAMAARMRGLVSLNETAAAMWNILLEDRTEDEVVQLLAQEYEAEPEALRRSVRAFVQKLEEEGMLEQ